jgi:hypothetical protein
MATGLKWARWRRAALSAPGSDMTGVTELDLINVTLVTDYSGQTTEVPSLGLGFDSEGMTVRKADGAPFVRVPWSSIVAVNADVVGSQRHQLATAMELDIQSDKKHHRFLVPNVQPAALTGSLGAMSRMYGKTPLVVGSKLPRR